MVILLVTLFAISFFVTLNYRDISNKRYIRKRLKNLKVGESIIIPTEYHLYADYLITKGKVGLEFTSKVGDVKTEISRIK
ncbi:hypothetical protein [Paraprevotella clara]|jgi:hypothetical protein|uniref:hypothetical protein n=1 Tax=Paraprevotella clara TaxID=454154 RepID=UPI00241F7F04|nr:hypothetical protein [Paraprevotella clara]MBD9176730.1 hypothetical protein [Paraprevotella clara]